MSFRKRGEVISAGGRTPNAVPGRGPPLGAPGSVPAVPGRGPLPVPVRGPAVPGRTPMGGLGGMRSPSVSGSMSVDSVTGSMKRLAVDQEFKHPGVRPSTINSQSTTSTGCSDLDKILGHSGLPLGSSMLIEESGTTDFGSVLAKAFASQGIVHNRLDPKSSNTHVIVLSANNMWGKELPGVYKGSSREIKKAKVMANENKVSVQNLINGDSKPPQRAPPPTKDADLKIAWRYGLNDPSKKQQQNFNLDNEMYKDFNHQFDITSRLVPSPGPNEITFIPITSSFTPAIKQIEHIISQHKNKIIRLVIPSFLNPAMYAPQLTSPHEVLPFIHTLRSLTRKHSKLVIATTIALDLYPRESALLRHMETLFDSVFHLEPFNQDMMKFLEKAYHNQPTKVQHGLVHVYKIPYLSERGHMMVMKSEFAFKNGRKKFEIEEWGIPVEDEGDPQQTTQNIEF